MRTFEKTFFKFSKIEYSNAFVFAIFLGRFRKYHTENTTPKIRKTGIVRNKKGKLRI